MYGRGIIYFGFLVLEAGKSERAAYTCSTSDEGLVLLQFIVEEKLARVHIQKDRKIRSGLAFQQFALLTNVVP